MDVPIRVGKNRCSTLFLFTLGVVGMGKQEIFRKLWVGLLFFLLLRKELISAEDFCPLWSLNRDDKSLFSDLLLAKNMFKASWKVVPYFQAWKWAMWILVREWGIGSAQIQIPFWVRQLALITVFCDRRRSPLFPLKKGFFGFAIIYAGGETERLTGLFDFQEITLPQGLFWQDLVESWTFDTDKKSDCLSHFPLRLVGVFTWTGF